MGHKRPYYTPEFKTEAIQLARESTKHTSAVARDIGISENASRKWMRQADIDEGKGTEGAWVQI